MDTWEQLSNWPYFFHFSLVAIGCSCYPLPLSQSYRSSIAVVSGKVIAVESYPNDSSLLKVKFEVYESFKGIKIKEFFILNPDTAPTMCTIYLHPGEELLVYLYEDQILKKPFLSYCSRWFPLDYIQQDDEEIPLLKQLKQLDLGYASTFEVDFRSSDFSSGLWKLKTSSSTPAYAVFEVSVDRLNYWNDVQVLKGFGTKLDEELIDNLENTKWFFDDFSDNETPTVCRFFIILKNSQYPNSMNYHLSVF